MTSSAPGPDDLEKRIAKRLHYALNDLAMNGVSFPGAAKGLATGQSGRAIIRLSVEEVARLAAEVAIGKGIEET